MSGQDARAALALTAHTRAAPDLVARAQRLGPAVPPALAGQGVAAVTEPMLPAG